MDETAIRSINLELYILFQQLYSDCPPVGSSSDHQRKRAGILPTHSSREIPVLLKFSDPQSHSGMKVHNIQLYMYFNQTLQILLLIKYIHTLLLIQFVTLVALGVSDQYHILIYYNSMKVRHFKCGVM